MPDVTANSHRQPEDRFLTWVDTLVDPAGSIRVPDADLADVAGTAAFVQRAAGPGSAPTLPPDRIESMWEEIMTASPTTVTLTPALPASNGARSIASRALPGVPSSGWRTWLPTALLIAAIVMAGFAAAWRIAGPFDLGGDGDDSRIAHHPGVAGSATPAASAEGCPLTNDMLIFVGEVPPLRVDGAGPSLAVVEPDGDFVITCSGVDNPAPLMTGIANAMPLQWPGTVLLERDDGSVLAFNVAIGERVELGDSDVVYGMYQVNQLAPSWLLSPNNGAATDWRVTNLETMTSFVLSDELGGVLEESRTLSITTVDGSDIAVISIDGVFASSAGLNIDISLPPNSDDAITVDVPDGDLVVDSNFDTRRWIDATGSIAVSPDGSTIAYQTQGESGQVIRIEDAVSGDLLAELTASDFVGTPASELAFDGDGDALVYLDGNAVWIATWDGDLVTTQVDTGEMRPSAVHTGDDPDRVVVERLDDTGGPRTALTGNRAISVLDTGTATLTHVDGLIADNNNTFTSLAFVLRLDYVVTVVTTPDDPDQVVMQLVDTSTGERVVRSEPIPAAAITDSAFATYSGDGAIAVVNFDETRAVYLNANTATVAPISRELLSGFQQFDVAGWIIAPSTDGKYLYAFGEPASAGDGYISISMSSSRPSWSLPLDSLPRGAIPGVPADDASHEPAVLEAQEFASPAPARTVASPVAGSASCDVSGDIPAVTGAEPELPGTVLRLVDGTLMLECDAGFRIVADDVSEVVPGSTWPGAVLLHMNDGSLKGINLLTGAEGDLGAYGDQAQLAYGRTSRWIFFPTTPEQLDWRIIDLETMESFLISEELGGVLPHSTVAHLWATTPDAAVIGFGGTPNLPAGTGSFDLGATPAAGTPAADPPAEWSALVIDGSLENRRWIETSRPMLTSAWISPDSEVLAYLVPTVDDGFAVRVERLSDGELIADTGITVTGNDAFLVFDGGLLQFTPDGLDRVTWDDNGEVSSETLLAFDVPQEHPVLRQTTDPNIVVATAGTPDPSSDRAGYLVDVASGVVTEVPGMLLTAFYSGQFDDGSPVRYVLATVPASSPDRLVVQLVDVATGEPSVVSEALDVTAQELAQAPTAIRGDVGFVFLPDGRTVALDAASGETFVIDPPHSLQLTYQQPSPGGDLLWVASGSTMFVRAVKPDAAWIEVQPESQFWFLAGSDGERR